MNREKTEVVDLTKKEVFTFLGFNFYRGRTRSGKEESTKALDASA